MTITQLILAALATWQIVEIWRHGTLFAGWRARVELWEGRAGELLGCGFCLSVWVAFLGTTTMAMLPWPLEQSKLGWLWLPTSLVQLFVFAMAVSRLANLGNDVFHSFNRTGKAQEITTHVARDPRTDDPFNGGTPPGNV